MFLPENAAAKSKEEEERKAAFKKIEQWSMEIIPQEIRSEAQVSVQEVQCGDPNCAPIDTAVSIVFNRYVAKINLQHGRFQKNKERRNLTMVVIFV